MSEIRALCEKDLTAAISLADDIFRDSKQKSMAEGFPNIFSKHTINQSFGAFDGERLVSFLGLVPSVVCIGAAKLNVYSLGSVCTHPDYRGRGCAGAVLEHVIKRSEEAGASLLLVSGSRSLYTRANCHPFGEMTQFTLDPQAALTILSRHSGDEVNIREYEVTDLFGMTDLANSRGSHFEQSISDLALLIKAEAYASCIKLHHKVLVAEKDGGLAGFAVIGIPYRREQKRQPVAIEWAGDSDVVALLLASAVERFNLTQLEVPVTWYERGLMSNFSGLSAKSGKNYGTVKVIHPERLINQLRPYLQEQNAELSRQFTVKQLDNDVTEVSLKGDRMRLDSRAFVSLLFDPEPVPEVDERLKGSVAELFPVPFPYTGGLNYV